MWFLPVSALANAEGAAMIATVLNGRCWKLAVKVITKTLLISHVYGSDTWKSSSVARGSLL